MTKALVISHFTGHRHMYTVVVDSSLFIPLTYFSWQSVNEDCEKPVEGYQGNINEILLKMSIDSWQFLSHQPLHNSLWEEGR